MFISSDNADRFLKLASTRGCTVSTMVLSATRGLVLFRVIREGIGLTQRLSATGTVRLQAIRMLTLEPERLKNQLATTRKRSPEMEGSSPRRSSGLRFQFLNVEVFSLLPQRQCNGCNLTRQGQTHHGRLDAFGQRSLVKILKRPGLYTGPSGSSFEQAFQIVVVIFIQAANGNLLSGAPQLAFDIAVFPAVAGFQP